MKVQEIMTTGVKTCRPDDDLGTAAKIMWDWDCGIVPVTGGAGELLGVVTDRDICMAVATQGRTASAIRVGDVISEKVYACGPGQEINSALETMRTERVHRLPVIDSQGVLRGILSLNDVILRAEARKPAGRTEGVLYDRVMDALKSISEHRRTDVSSEKEEIPATALGY